jgi:nucleoside-triphosphatase
VEQIDVPAHGFYTAEIREGGQRQGFEIITLAGDRAILAHVGFQSDHRISKYRVDVSALEAVAVAAVRMGIGAGGLVVIDEIGPMELVSDRFRRVVVDALDSEVAVLGTIHQRSTPFIDRIKARRDVEVIEVSRENRDRLVDQVLDRLQVQ